jgi:hypothetical protein
MISNFLIFCSGADVGMIDQCPKSERNKYASIGSTVFLTGFLAAISSGYALYTIFRGEEYAFLAAIGFGLVWATIIFNLDRYIVSSLRKEGNWKKELLYATPRFVIAILISLVIAKPLEVRIFASRIEQQILEDKRQKLEDEKLSIDKLNKQTQLDNQSKEEAAQLKGLEPLRFNDPPSEDFKKLLASRNQAVSEFNQTSQMNNPKISDYNSKINILIGNPNNYIPDSLKAPTDKLLPEFSKQRKELNYSKSILIGEIKSKQKKIDDWDSDIKKAREDYQAIIAKKIKDKEADIAKTNVEKEYADSMAGIQMKESYDVKDRSYNNNFITQVEALGNLNSKTFSTMWWTSILIMLLFVTIETAPIIVKLLSKRGPYDQLLERIEYEHYLEQQKIISDRNDEINNLLVEIKAMNKLKGEVRMKTEKSKLDAELQANTSLLDDIAKCQADLAKLAIDKWYNDELANFKSNPNNQYAQTKQQVKTPTLEDKLWKADNLQGEIFYLFKNGQPTNNELVYMEGGETAKGSWEYITANKEIKVNILNNTETYTIEDLTETSAKLKTLTNDYLELTKV